MPEGCANAGPLPGLVKTESSEIETLRQEVERLKAEVARDEKLKALGILAGGMAHDFNNILTSVACHASLALTDMRHPDAVDAVGQIVKAIERARGIARQVLEFNRPSRNARAAMSLGPLVEEVLELLRPIVSGEVELAYEPAAGGDVVLGNATQLHQLLLNLCQNAVHAMQGRRGRIVVAVDAIEVDAPFAGELPGLRPGPHVRLSVSDDGHGMDAAILQRIFEPFFTTKPEGRGTGLGLAVVHRVVSDHGGAVQVASEPDRGTIFRLYFPAYPSPLPSR